METTKTHWKKLTNTTYLGSWDFEANEERTLTIRAVTNETVKDQNGKDDEVVLMVFDDSKPMILNKTNLKAVEKSTGTPIIEEWVGKSVTLYTTRIRAFGEEVDALRISPAVAKKAAKPTISEDRFVSALASIELGTYTVEKLKAQFKLTKEQIERL